MPHLGLRDAPFGCLDVDKWSSSKALVQEERPSPTTGVNTRPRHRSHHGIASLVRSAEADETHLHNVSRTHPRGVVTVGGAHDDGDGDVEGAGHSRSGEKPSPVSAAVPAVPTPSSGGIGRAKLAAAF